MVNKYKKIVLLQGLEKMSDYQFRMVKSLLTKELKLTKKLQDEYDRIRIADLMEDKFPHDAGLGELIKACEDIPDIGNLPEALKKERKKVTKEKNGQVKAAKKRNKQEEPSTSQPKSPTIKDKDPGTVKNSPSPKKKKGSTTKSADIRSFLHWKTNRLHETSGTIAGLAESGLPASHRPPPNPPSSSSIKKSEGTRLETHNTMRTQVYDEKEYQSPGWPATSTCWTMSAPLTPPGPPAAASISLKTSPASPKLSHSVWAQGPRAITPSCVQAPQVPRAIPSSSHQTKTPPQTSYVLTQTHRGTPAGAFVLDDSPQMPPATSSCSLQSPQVLFRPSSNVQDIWGAPVTPPSYAQAPPVPEEKLNNLLASRVSSVKAPSGLCTPQALPASTSRSHLAPQEPPTQACSGFLNPLTSPATASKRPRLTNIPKEPSREEDYQTGPKEVTVLKATKPFTYEMREGKTMFHATVATEHEFFRVKVFDISLKEKFVPGGVIAISHYYGLNGFLEIYNASCVSEIKTSSKMDIKPMLKRNASATPKIDYLYSQKRGIFVNGVFMVHKKYVRNECTYYVIGDTTGRMEVVVHGRLTDLHCEAGDKLRLFCFELTSTMDTCQLRSVMHSHMEVCILEHSLEEPHSS